MKSKKITKKQIKKQVLKAMKEEPAKDDIKKISLFGSHLDDTAKHDSDVDLLIEFKPKAVVGFFELIQIQENLAKNLGTKVDLLTPRSLSKYFRKDVLKQAELLYEKR